MPSDLYGVLPADHRLPYNMEDVRPHLRRRRLRRIPARVRARNALRQRAPRRPSGSRHRQPPRLPEDGRARASAASSTPKPPARWLTSSKRPNALGHAAHLCAGRVRLHGGPRSRKRRHHPRRRRDGGNHVLRHRAQHRPDHSIMPAAPAITPWPARASIPTSLSVGPPRASASWKAIPPCKRCIRVELEKLQRRRPHAAGIAGIHRRRRAPITNAGWTPDTPPRAAIATP